MIMDIVYGFSNLYLRVNWIIHIAAQYDYPARAKPYCVSNKSLILRLALGLSQRLCLDALP